MRIIARLEPFPVSKESFFVWCYPSGYGHEPFAGILCGSINTNSSTKLETQRTLRDAASVAKQVREDYL